jgi:hypothetical protein
MIDDKLVEEVYAALVERFGISEVFLPKYGKRREVSWKEFIKASIELNPGEEWAKVPWTLYRE